MGVGDLRGHVDCGYLWPVEVHLGHGVADQGQFDEVLHLRLPLGLRLHVPDFGGLAVVTALNMMLCRELEVLGLVPSAHLEFLWSLGQGLDDQGFRNLRMLSSDIDLGSMVAEHVENIGTSHADADLLEYPYGFQMYCIFLFLGKRVNEGLRQAEFTQDWERLPI